MVSQRLSACNMLMTPPCMCFSPQMLSKSRGFLVQARPLASASVNAVPSISSITGQQTIKHLGDVLGYDMQAASRFACPLRGLLAMD